MNPDEQVVQVQRGATLQDIANDHMAGMGGYAIAEKYGMDTERVKGIINDLDRNLAFVPPNEEGEKVAPVDAVEEPLIAPLAEGENPEPGKVAGHK